MYNPPTTLQSKRLIQNISHNELQALLKTLDNSKSPLRAD